MDWEDVFEVIGNIFKAIGIGLFYFFKYTLPVWFVVFAFIIGSCTGNSCHEDEYRDWNEEKMRENSYTIKIHWQNGKQDTSITVRKDLPFTVAGFRFDDDTYFYYYNYDTEHDYTDNTYDFVNTGDIYWTNQEGLADLMKTYGVKSGYQLEGFYTNPEGGTLVANAGGYGVITIDKCMEIYAVWRQVNE